ncbi:lipid II flippase Amj family protein [Clostridium sp. YIM B02505]|uniref:Lipid II flippase Amj n=1 Tax=Clostridium yunnanense TaxID=2800325 RepID=A0ABS1EI98_9CLOT|nr:lipid II flippase Amj family protein [Clostridium yunnanense]MBK1809094.1 lipid II flippase Amj family protein [Clostridium yunnanense]
MYDNYIILIVITLVIHLIDTLSYSVRLNSVKSGNFALSMSLFNLIVLVSRTANTFQGPLIGSLIDSSVKLKYNPIMDVRGIIFAASGGTILAIILIPTFLKLFEIALNKLEVSGSVPSLVVQSLSISNIKRIAKNTIKPKKSMLKNLRYKNIPKRLLLLNTFITGIYTVGVLAANYAVTFVPDKASTIVQSSGLINGIASILLTLFIDPKSAIITDEAYRGKREYGDVKALVIMLIGTKLLGTLLGQLLLVPSAKLLALIYQ